MEHISRFVVVLLTSLVVEITGECTVRYRPPDIKPCPKDTNDDGTNCWRGSYGRGAGRVPDKAPCPPGLRDDGTSCWSDAHIYGKGCCCTIWGCCGNCKSGYHDDGCTCRKTDVGIKVTLFQRYRCHSDEERNGALCYPKCKEGYYASGCCICVPHGKQGIELSAEDRKYCKDGSPLVNGQCQVTECK
ncbi:uncharacterized protein LOC123552364 [Mercenaria mercenaria]|uniref:uncharacterized protein LOC123552364 n=1 Tax=Mercenaria mercenaria TaxID=6596 RepID=UPI00234F227F|nr:uncharacterized protein LOC123552364 [Mercenaria mercenaria]